MSAGFVVWLTGPSGSGKSTLAGMLAERIRQRHQNVSLIDGEDVRKKARRPLGFSREDRDRHVRNLGHLAKELREGGACVIVSAISPYRETRNEQRRELVLFCEVFCSCSLKTLIQRDTKGLYGRALAGELPNLTGVNDPYEPPLQPEVVAHTDEESPSQSVERILATLEDLGYWAGAACESVRRDEITGGRARTRRAATRSRTRR